MTRKSLFMQTLAASLLLLSGCDVAQSARADLNRLVSSDPFKTTPQAKPAARAATPAAKPVAPGQAATASATAASSSAGPSSVGSSSVGSSAAAPSTGPETRPPAEQASINLIGKNEGEVRALFGPPTAVEERAPGKTWHYRDGKCTLDVQLYPDVQTRQFATLAYEVKNDDSTDEGNRACLGQFRAHAQPQ